MTRDERALRDILQAIEKIEHRAQSGQNAFLNSEDTQDAILYRLAVIGEAITRLSEEAKAANPQVEWRRIQRFRNIVIHDYNRVDLAIVWQIIQDDLPVLKQRIQAVQPQS